MVRKLCLIENCQQQIMREVCGTGNDKAGEKYKDLQENKRSSSGSGYRGQVTSWHFCQLNHINWWCYFYSICLLTKALAILPA